MNILLAGADGFLGCHVARMLVEEGHRVVPVSRRHGVDFARMRLPADWRGWLAGVDAVINCVGIIGETRSQKFAALHTQAPCALFRACAEAGVRRVVQVSALGADGQAFSAYHLSKCAVDDCLRGLNLDWFVLRPSLVYGPGGHSSALFMRLAAAPVIPVIGDGRQVVQPVHVSDVVAAVVHCLGSRAPCQTLDVVGPQCFTFEEWLQTMRQAQGKPHGRVLRVPMGLVRHAAQWLRHVWPMAQPDNLRMLAQGYRADPAPLSRFLGRAPRAVQPALFLSATAPLPAQEGQPS